MGYNSNLPTHTNDKLRQCPKPRKDHHGKVVACELEEEPELVALLCAASVNDSRYRFVAGLENAERHADTIRFFA